MSPTPEALEAVRSLTALLRSSEPMNESDRRRLSDQHLRRNVSRMLQTGETYSEAQGAGGVIDLSGPEDAFRARLRSIDDNLSAQVSIVRDGVENYFETGTMPAPYYAWRIAVILRKAKEVDLEAGFLEAFTAHFRDGLGRRYQQIAERALKARALAQRGK